MKDTPKRSNEPVVWLLFGAGTTVSAMFYPVLVLILGFLLPFGLIDPKNIIELIGFLHSPLGKLLLLVLLIFPMWEQCTVSIMVCMTSKSTFRQVVSFSMVYLCFIRY